MAMKGSVHAAGSVPEPKPTNDGLKGWVASGGRPLSEVPPPPPDYALLGAKPEASTKGHPLDPSKVISNQPFQTIVSGAPDKSLLGGTGATRGEWYITTPGQCIHEQIN
eukprot:1034864-Prorocentrum_minimum.AAC.1